MWMLYNFLTDDLRQQICGSIEEFWKYYEQSMWAISFKENVYQKQTYDRIKKK